MSEKYPDMFQPIPDLGPQVPPYEVQAIKKRAFSFSSEWERRLVFEGKSLLHARCSHDQTLPYPKQRLAVNMRPRIEDPWIDVQVHCGVWEFLKGDSYSETVELSRVVVIGFLGQEDAPWFRLTHLLKAKEDEIPDLSGVGHNLIGRSKAQVISLFNREGRLLVTLHGAWRDKHIRKGTYALIEPQIEPDDPEFKPAVVSAFAVACMWG